MSKTAYNRVFTLRALNGRLGSRAYALDHICPSPLAWANVVKTRNVVRHCILKDKIGKE